MASGAPATFKLGFAKSSSDELQAGRAALTRRVDQKLYSKRMCGGPLTGAHADQRPVSWGVRSVSIMLLTI